MRDPVVAEGVEPAQLAPYATGIGAMLPEMIGRFAQQIAAGEFPGDRSTVASSRSSIDGLAHLSTSLRRADGSDPR
ncbi:hypothetical protein DSM104299_02734 [Baekduia alba]|uniref:imine reductase family protein n=1 Tax=Baekduia alba TaxID=2997333 RepID=UPI00234124E2|nr:hypothetical protein [Baekduia alba]WCB94006.1 hypothetical protein DSM104299_02734 [Baekduia alba]